MSALIDRNVCGGRLLCCGAGARVAVGNRRSAAELVLVSNNWVTTQPMYTVINKVVEAA
jgi:hypothetical protein